MVNRRSLLKAIGGIGVVGTASGIGVMSMSGSGAAAEISISASNPAEISNDRGDISEVTVDPQFSLTWEGLDDAVGKVFYLVEAKVGENGSWEPIFRATPWIDDDINNSYIRQVPGTTGEYTLKQPHSAVLNQDSRFRDGDEPDFSAGPLVIANERGRPDYESIDFESITSVDLSSYLNGTSMSSADKYPGAHEDGGHQNNYHDIDAGYYGAAADTSLLDNGTDGSTDSTPVLVRYTFELQRPNLSQLEYRDDIDFSDAEDEEEEKAIAAESLDWLEEEDIDTGNSKIVMNGEDGNTSFGNPTGIPYSSLQNNADSHVGVLTEKAAFDVTAINEESDSGVTGTSNAGAE